MLLDMLVLQNIWKWKEGLAVPCRAFEKRRSTVKDAKVYFVVFTFSDYPLGIYTNGWLWQKTFDQLALDADLIFSDIG
jgi:hypothetical protein